jgi:hypothetical protein
MKIKPPWTDGDTGYGFWIDELPKEVASALQMLVDEGTCYGSQRRSRP